MLSKLCFSDLACEFSSKIYDEFLDKVYGLNNCTQEGTYDERDEYLLQLDLKSAGIKSTLDLKKEGIDVNLIDGIKGVGKFFIIYNNINYITNNNVGASGFVHIQAISSTTWTIINPLAFCPNVTTINTNGDTIYGQVSYSTDCKTITITFNSAIAGKAYLS
jgi:hypothetical protein